MTGSGISLEKMPANLRFTATAPGRWQAPARDPNRAPARVLADHPGTEVLLAELVSQDRCALRRPVDVPRFPGIRHVILAMADVHPGYGFPTGGVSAFAADAGVVSKAGAGFDLNRRVRTLRTPLYAADLPGREYRALSQIGRDIRAGPGSEGGISFESGQRGGLATLRRIWHVGRGHMHESATRAGGQYG